MLSFMKSVLVLNKLGFGSWEDNFLKIDYIKDLIYYSSVVISD